MYRTVEYVNALSSPLMADLFCRKVMASAGQYRDTRMRYIFANEMRVKFNSFGMKYTLFWFYVDLFQLRTFLRFERTKVFVRKLFL